jgi:LCP family protein required for cell wall assembly
VKPTKRHWPQYLGALVLIVLLAGVGAASAALLQVKEVVDIIHESGTPVSEATKNTLDDVPAGKPQTLLLIGSDKRSANSADVKGGSGGGARSDTLMLARLDPEQGATAVLSIPRDTKAQIPLPGGGFRTAKINEAFADGGEKLTIRTVRKLLGVPINHVLIINFGAFERAVNRLGCLYQDIDHSFFNDNSQGGDKYASIDVKAGYQLLCGQDTLDWVRFRHLDSDFVRAARQQEFLRSAKAQIAASKIVDDRKTLIRIFATYSQTDITSTTAILGLLKLALNSASQPVRSVKFRGFTTTADTFVGVTDADLAIMRRQFTELKSANGPAADTTEVEKVRKKAKKKAVKKQGLAPGLVRVPDEMALPTLSKASFDLAADTLPLYYPSVRLAAGGYTTRDGARVYDIVTRTKKKYSSYRLSLYYGENGQYYGVQGTKWRNPPILKEQHHRVTRNGRPLDVYPAGSRYRLISWRTPRGVYWVSNTVSLRLTNQQMLDIAANLKRVPG